jgi:hypothetical protein
MIQKVFLFNVIVAADPQQLPLILIHNNTSQILQTTPWTNSTNKSVRAIN